MASAIAVRLAMACCLMGGSAVACLGQGYTPPPPPLTTLPPCPVPKDAKEAKKIAKRKDCDPTNKPAPPAPAVSVPAPGSSAEKFPYPGETSTKAAATPTAQAFPYPGESGGQPGTDSAPKSSDSAAKQYPYPGEPGGGTSPDVPHDPAAEKKASETPAGKAFPYPGDPAPSETPATGAGSTPAESSSSSSSDSSSSSSSDSAVKGSASDDDDDPSQPKLADKGSEGKRNKKTVKPQTDSERVDEDLSVAKFYGQSGNFMGAYLRAKDAVKTQPDYAEAHFVLGEAARRLKKQDEAKTEFNEYLKLAPGGERAKAAEKALDELR